MLDPPGRQSVSVVIPTYNSGHFIAETLRSVFAQTLPPLEVIVSDDRSTDGTPGLVEEIALTAPVPVRLIRADCNSGGPAGPLNRGIAAARGELIATLDHDDFMLPLKLERQAACFAASPGIELVFARCRVPGEDQRSREIERVQASALRGLGGTEVGPSARRIAGADVYAGLSASNFALTCSNMLFRAETCRRLGGFDERFRLSVDHQFCQKMTRWADMGFVDEELTIWNLSHESLYRSATEFEDIVRPTSSSRTSIALAYHRRSAARFGLACGMKPLI